MGGNGVIDSNGAGTYVATHRLPVTCFPDFVSLYLSDLEGSVVVNLKGTSDLFYAGGEQGSSCQFVGVTFGGNVTVTMSDPLAMLGVDQFGDTSQSLISFGGLFTANLNGPNSTVSIAPFNFPLSYNLVAFNAGANINGKAGAGDVLTYYPTHITGTFNAKNIKKVLL